MTVNNPETREDRERLVASLGIPADAAGAGHYVDHGGPVQAATLAALADQGVAERIWRRWNSTQSRRIELPAFRLAFRRFLAAGASMGYSLDRFRWVSQSLPDIDPDGERWIEPFERAVAARNAIDLRVFVRSEIRDTFLATNQLSSQGAEGWNSVLSVMTDGLFYELGMIVPRVELVGDNSLAATELRIAVNDAQLPRQALLPAGFLLVNATPDRLSQINVKAEKAVNPANRVECGVIEQADAERCKQAGLTVWTPMGYAILSVSEVARRMAGAFVNRQLVDRYLELLSPAFPNGLAAVLKVVSRDAIAQVLRALLEEEISIRNLRRILEVLTLPEVRIRADLSPYICFEPPAVGRAQLQVNGSVIDRHLCRVRSAMKRYISHKFTRGQSTLVVYLLESTLEKRLTNLRPLSTREHAALVEAVADEIGNLPPSAPQPAILTTASIRLRLQREIGSAFPRTVVLAYQELSPEMNIQPIARITAPEVTDVLASLHLPDEKRSWLLLGGPPEDLLAQRLNSFRDKVLAEVKRDGEFAEYAGSFAAECFDALLGELSGRSSAVQLAAALPHRAEGSSAWERVVEVIFRVGRAARRALTAPTEAEPEAQSGYIAELARVRDVMCRIVRTVADAGLRHERRSTCS